MVRATAARMIGRRSSTTACWLIRHGAPAEKGDRAPGDDRGEAEIVATDGKHDRGHPVLPALNESPTNSTCRCRAAGRPMIAPTGAATKPPNSLVGHEAPSE